VLAQLGMKVQHALRAFTAADRKVIKQTAENYPETRFYKTEDLITQLGIGEALITILNEKGIPSPLVHAMMAPPRSRMDILTETEIAAIVKNSKIAADYNKVVDNKSAYEILNEKINSAQQQSGTAKEKEKKEKEESWLDNPMVKSAGRTAATMITRSLLGVLGIGSTRRRRSRSIF
jgi:hypothetical protein